MFVWDESKRLKVIENHKVDFALIFDVFEDPFPFDYEDYEHSNETEIRYGIIGQTVEYGLISLIYMIVNNGDVRFITARKAEKWMVNVYEENRKRL
ncbi:MAG: BrnT family toxin [Acidobacteriota bacterium]